MKSVLLLCFWIPLFGLTQGGEDCRMKESEIVPVIDRFNPFFVDHTWESFDKLEVARLDDKRLITIRQKACLRHHILITMFIDQTEINDDPRFWITEVLVMMKRIFFNNPEYMKYKRLFENEFIRVFLLSGTNAMFNFPLGERSFICKVETGDWGAKVKVEVVRFIIREKIRRPGIPREMDDGWFKDETVQKTNPVPGQ